MDAAVREFEEAARSAPSRATSLRPVFVDDSGERRRLFRVGAFFTALLCTAYVGLVLFGLLGHGPLAALRLPFVPHHAHTTAVKMPSNGAAPVATLAGVDSRRGNTAAADLTDAHSAGRPDPAITSASLAVGAPSRGLGPVTVHRGNPATPPATVDPPPTPTTLPGNGNGNGSGTGNGNGKGQDNRGGNGNGAASPPADPGHSGSAPGHTNGKAANPSH